MPNATPYQICIKNDELIKEEYKDSKKSAKEIYLLLEETLGESFVRINFKKGQRIATGCFKGATKDYYFLVANLTFMGGKEGQHPKDLKRIQYNVMWREFYEEYSKKGEVLWFGLYSYKDMNIWAFFKPETYLKKHEGKKMVSKGGHKARYSCHIFLNDLYQGYKLDYFEKVDKNGNVVGAIRNDCLRNFLSEDNLEVNPIIEVINKINTNQVRWNEWIVANEAIPYMKQLKRSTGFNQWKQNLWNGWYIEALYSEYLYNHPSEYVDYTATSKNKNVLSEYKQSGLDLAFPKDPYHFIGDLKAVCEGYGDTLLNDETAVRNALEKYKKIWFIFYIHDKKGGKTNNYEMVRWRNQFIKEGEWDYKEHLEFNELSARNSPHSISFSEMVIVELNEITKDRYFTIGAQWGPNSDGKARKDKFKIKKKLLTQIADDSFVIYRYRPEG